jgi:hypothetical protein
VARLEPGLAARYDRCATLGPQAAAQRATEDTEMNPLHVTLGLLALTAILWLLSLAEDKL